MASKKDILNKYALQIVEIAPQSLVIVSNSEHPLYQERANWPVDEQLVADIKADGFNSTIIIGEEYDWVSQVGGEKQFQHYVVVAGRQRTKAAIAAKVETIPAMNIGDIDAIPESDLQALMLKENERRVNSSTLEKAQDAQRLYNLRLNEAKSKDWPEETPFKPSATEKADALEFVANVFGLVPKRITKMLSLLNEDKVSPELLKAISGADPEVSFKAALRLVSLSKDEQVATLERAKPIIERKAKEASTAGKNSTGKPRKTKALSDSEAASLVDKNAVVKIARADLEKIRARRHTPPDVKEFVKELLNPGSTSLDYLPGRLQPMHKKVEKAEDSE